MEARMDEFRGYLYESGVMSALSEALIKLYDQKSNRPENAILFIQRHLSYNYPTLAEFQSLVEEVDETRAKVEAYAAAEKAEKTVRENQVALVRSLINNKDCTSSLKRYLTMELYESLKDEKTQSGKRLFDCINSGLRNQNLAVGIYAADYEAYEKFGQIFNPIIEEYHKFSGSDVHPMADIWPNSNFEDLNQEYVVSIRIRCARSIAKFPLFPGMSEGDYSDLMIKAKEVTDTLSGDLEGTFYKLESIDEDIKKLIGNFHLLKSAKHLQDAGALKYFPRGRAVFKNTSSTFLLLVNEEDHLKFICKLDNCKIGEAYTLMKQAVEEFSRKLKFQRHNRLGYITFCPTNLGSALRVSVIIKLSNVPDYYLEKIAEKGIVQFREIIDSETTDMMYEISSKKKLGLSEYQVVKEMYDVINEITTEDEKFSDPVYLIEEIKRNPDSKSLLKKHITLDVFNNLKDLKTKSEKTLLDCIRSGLRNPDSLVGIYAADVDAYETFKVLFNQIINDYHQFLETENHPEDGWQGDETYFKDLNIKQRYISSIRITCSRSIANFSLLPGMSEEDFINLMNDVKSVTDTLTGDLEGTFHDLEHIDGDTEKLIANFNLFESKRHLKDAGALKYWPKGRGVFVNNAETFLVSVNEEDHLKFISTVDGGQLQHAYSLLREAVEAFSNLNFERDIHLGYITLCPTNLGSAVRVSVMIELSNLSKEKLQEIGQNEDVQLREIFYENSKVTKGIYEVSNKIKLGLTEYDVVKGMYHVINEIITEEEQIGAIKALQ